MKNLPVKGLESRGLSSPFSVRVVRIPDLSNGIKEEYCPCLERSWSASYHLVWRSRLSLALAMA